MSTTCKTVGLAKNTTRISTDYAQKSSRTWHSGRLEVEALGRIILHSYSSEIGKRPNTFESEAEIQLASGKPADGLRFLGGTDKASDDPIGPFIH